MVKVMLIRPSQVRWKNEAKRIGAPIGILSLASILRENNVEVNVIDSAVEGYGQEREIKKDLFEYGLSNIEIEKRISNFNPDFVGINATHTSYWNQQKSIAKLVKKINPRVKVLIGGHYASGSASYITENVREIDHIFIGESESTLLKFIKLGGPKIIYGQEEKLTSLPNPAFNLIHSENYLPQMSHFGKPKGNNFITNVITRGCPSACDYCTSSYYFGRKVRHYSLERIAQQLQTLKE